MPFAVEMYMDSVAEAAIWELWQAIADAGVSSCVVKSGARPHVSLALYNKLDLAEFRSELEGFADKTKPFAVTFTSIATFPTEEGVVFLAPVVTQGLLDVHANFHDTFFRYRPEVSAYYLPNQWVPHCTVAMDLKADQIGRVMDICRQVRFPIGGKFEGIGVIEYRPVKELFVYDLGGGKA